MSAKIMPPTEMLKNKGYSGIKPHKRIFLKSQALQQKRKKESSLE